jgi:hypothetical protein
MGFYEYFYIPVLGTKRRHLSGIEHFKTGKDQYNYKREEHHIGGALPICRVQGGSSPRTLEEQQRQQ